MRSAAVLVLLLSVAACGGGTASVQQRAAPAPAPTLAPVAEPTPYDVPTSPATDALPVIAPTGVRPLAEGERSMPWGLIRLWDEGQRLALQYTGGCDGEVDVRWEQTAAHVLVQVVEDEDGDCPWYRRVVHRAILELDAPLAGRPLLHAATSTPDEDPHPGRSLAERFDPAPGWPGEPWFRDGREVPHFELTVAAGPEHCQWQRATYLSGDGLRAPRDDAGGLWARDPHGVLDHHPRAQAEFRSPATLPRDAAFTGYHQGPVEVWTAPSDGAAYVYLVNAEDPADVERWVRGGGGCA